MTEEHSLITDEHRALIGQPGKPRTIVISAEDAIRMRDILGDTDPRYADGTGIAPPYTIAAVQSRPPRLRLLPNGILTQQEWRFTRPFRIGETLTMTSQVLDIRERMGGRYGHTILLTHSTDYYDESGNHVAAALMTITQFDPATGRKGDHE